MIEGEISPRELMNVAEALAQERSISLDKVLDALREGLHRAALGRYGQDLDIEVTLDPEVGELSLVCRKKVVDQVVDQAKEVDLQFAKRAQPGAKIGDVIEIPLPIWNMDRTDIQIARRSVVSCVKDAQREELCIRYEEKIGTLVTGFVKRVDAKGLAVNVGDDEVFLKRTAMIPRETFRPQDRIRLYVVGIDKDAWEGPQVVFSRTDPQFLACLFHQEVPEVYDKLVEIKSVSWHPGSRGKIAVSSRDPSVDPVGACVGFGGSRVKAVIEELGGEKIDIVQWSPDPATFVTRALSSVEVRQVEPKDETNTLEIVVPDNQVSLAIGRSGQNVELISKLVGWNLRVEGETEANERKKKEVESKIQVFAEVLDVDEIIAQLLLLEGFGTLDQLAEADVEDLIEIEAFDKSLAKEISERARSHVDKRDKDIEDELKKMKVSAQLMSFDKILTRPVLLGLSKGGVKTVGDLADLSLLDLISPEGGILCDFDVPRKELEKLIMKAREAEGWFAGE